MKKVPVERAMGMTLCHDVTEIRDGFRGPAFRRGHVVGPGDAERLLDMGKRHVFVWEPGASEVHEDDCARRMAAANPVPGARWEGPSEGKVTLVAETSGLWRADPARLAAVNAVPDATVTALPDHYPVRPGARLAAARIVPLVTAEENVRRFEELCRDGGLFKLLPYRPRRAGLVITGSEIWSGRVQDRFEKILRAKLARYPGEVVGAYVCDDDRDMIADRARELLAAGADLLIFTGGMSVDPDDVTPAAVRALGAEIVSYGIPAQPGNMSLVAYLGDAALLGVPGAAAAAPVTALDVLLPQIFAGPKFTAAELRGLASGGLCQGCADCRFPNCTFGRY